MVRNLSFAVALVSSPLCAQQVQWLTATPNDWLLNPTSPVDVLCARDPDHVYSGRLEAVTYTYNQPMGTSTVRRQGSDGATIWSVNIGDTVQLESIVGDADGNVVIGGRYFQRLLIDGDPVLGVPPGHASEGSFLIAFDADGQLLWQQDVSGGDLQSVSVSSLAVDPQGRVWAALSTFMDANIVLLGPDGTQVEGRTLEGSKTIGSISFDPWGGLYVSGAAGSPDIEINGTTFPVAEQYAFFVTRMNALGIAEWFQYAHDITFQKPRVQADATGHAYVFGPYFEPLAWGDFTFTDPRWSVSFFLTRVDSLGTFDLGIQPPNSMSSGQFTPARGNGLGVDPAGNAYVLGTLGGASDWGNGLVTGSGDITNNTVVLMKFDDTGTPSWAVEGGSGHTDIMNDLSVTADGICHFIGITSDPFTYGPFTEDPVNGRGSVVARVDPELTTNVRNSTMEAELIACPSVFSSGFRLMGRSLVNSADIKVEIIDATGRVAQRANGLSDELGARLAPGTYTVTVHAAERTLRTRVLKQ